MPTILPSAPVTSPKPEPRETDEPAKDRVTNRRFVRDHAVDTDVAQRVDPHLAQPAERLRNIVVPERIARR